MVNSPGIATKGIDYPGIRVTPNPVEEGEEITIVGDAHGEVVVSYKGKVTRVPLDKNGKAKIKAPGLGGEEFLVTDGKLPKASFVKVKVVSGFKTGG